MGIDWGQVLNVAGGASRGWLEGQRDLQDKAQFDYLQQKRKADLEQMAIEKAAEAKASGVLPEGEYPYEDRSQMGLNEVGPSPKTQMVKRTAGDVEKEQIAALRGGTATQRSQAIQMQTAAQQRQQFDFQMHQQRVTQLGMTASIMAHQNPEAAMQLIAQNYNEHVHDGQQMIVQRGANGQPMYGYAVGGKLTGPLQAITPEIALQHAGMVMRYASPQMWDAMEKAKTAARNAGAAERTAGAHETVARTGEKKAEWETTGPGGKAEIDFKEAQAGYYSRMPRAAGEGSGADTYGTPIPMLNEAGEMTYGIPTKKGVGPPTIQPVTLGPGLRFAKPPPVMNDQQKAAYTTFLKNEAEGGWKNDAARDDFISTNKLQPFLGETLVEKYVKQKQAGGAGAATKKKEIDPKALSEWSVIRAQLDQGGQTYGERVKLEKRLKELAGE